MRAHGRTQQSFVTLWPSLATGALYILSVGFAPVTDCQNVDDVPFPFLIPDAHAEAACSSELSAEMFDIAFSGLAVAPERHQYLHRLLAFDLLQIAAGLRRLFETLLHMPKSRNTSS